MVVVVVQVVEAVAVAFVVVAVTVVVVVLLVAVVVVVVVAAAAGVVVVVVALDQLRDAGPGKKHHNIVILPILSPRRKVILPAVSVPALDADAEHDKPSNWNVGSPMLSVSWLPALMSVLLTPAILFPKPVPITMSIVFAAAFVVYTRHRLCSVPASVLHVVVPLH